MSVVGGFGVWSAGLGVDAFELEAVEPEGFPEPKPNTVNPIELETGLRPTSAGIPDTWVVVGYPKY